MKKINKSHGFFWGTLVFLIFSGIMGYANWVQSNLLPSPGLRSLTLSELSSAWNREEKPLFPPQSSWSNSFDYNIYLSSRWKPKAVPTSYSGGQNGIQQDVPFILFYVYCKYSQIEQIQDTHQDNLYFEEIEIRDNATKLHLSYHLLKGNTLETVRTDFGIGNYIIFQASFAYQSYCYYFEGIFPTYEPEFSPDDPNVLKVREIILQYVNSMVSD